jgi:hypothetical protein
MAEPTEPNRLTFSVAVGQPRSAGGFKSITWRLSGGATGTYSCGCAAGATIPITVQTSNYAQQTVTVSTTNGQGQSSDSATSNAQSAFGTPVIQQTGAQADQNGVNYTWTVDWSGSSRRSETANGTPAQGSVRINAPCGTAADVTVTATSSKGTSASVQWHVLATACPAPAGPTGSITRVGNSVRLDFTELPVQSWSLRCWQISDPSQHNWSTNFLGSGNVTFGGHSGSVTFTCPTQPASGQPFMLEVWNFKYVGPINW